MVERGASSGRTRRCGARSRRCRGTGNQFRLYVRIQQPGSLAVDAYMLRTNQLSGTDEVYLERVDNSTFVRLLTVSQELAVGDMLLLAGEGLEAGGVVEAGLGVVAAGGRDRHDVSGGGLCRGRGCAARPAASTTSGRVIWGAASDTEPPSAPGELAGERCVARAGSISRWQAATDNVGVSEYRVERCAGRGLLELLRRSRRRAATSYSDTGLSRVDRLLLSGAGRGCGPEPRGRTRTSLRRRRWRRAVTRRSRWRCSTDFNRANESPLSGGGKWSNGVNGSNETGLRVVSNALSCSKSTSCASWWNVGQFGPDTEVWGHDHDAAGAMGISFGCMCGSSSRARWRSMRTCCGRIRCRGRTEVYLRACR